MNHPPAPKKQTQNKPNSNPKQSQFKPCPERIEFTLSVIEGNGPILIGAALLTDLKILVTVQSRHR